MEYNAEQSRASLIKNGAGELSIGLLMLSSTLAGVAVAASTEYDVCRNSVGQEITLRATANGVLPEEALRLGSQARDNAGIFQCVGTIFRGLGPSEMAHFNGLYVSDPNTGSYTWRQPANTVTTLGLLVSRITAPLTVELLFNGADKIKRGLAAKKQHPEE